MLIFKKEVNCVLSLKILWSLKIISFLQFTHKDNCLGIYLTVEWLVDYL